MVKCDICGKSFDSYSKLGGHKSSHSRIKKVEERKCLYCNANMELLPSSNKKYCSLDCVYEHRRSERGSKKLVMYNGDAINLTYEESLKLRDEAVNCDICGKTEHINKKGNRKSLSLDHDHKTKEFRGFLCSSCNRNLGWFENYRESIEGYLNK